jgi:Flp pilus assembly protein TadB
MKNYKIVLLIVGWGLLFIAAGIAIIFIGRGTYSMLNISLVALILIIGSIYFLRKIRNAKEESEGLPEEDELSQAIKYKSGYRAYFVSMYIWLIIFILKSQFVNIETALGSGILLSALVFGVLRRTEKNKYFE